MVLFVHNATTSESDKLMEIPDTFEIENCSVTETK